MACELWLLAMCAIFGKTTMLDTPTTRKSISGHMALSVTSSPTRQSADRCMWSCKRKAIQAGHARIATMYVRRFRAACFAVQDVVGRTTVMGLERSTSEQSIVANLEAAT